MNLINEPVHLTDYDERWPALFAAERSRLGQALNLHAEQIEHIGSTAVRGLSAKPIIDVMLGVDTFPPDDDCIRRIVSLGYESLGEAGVSGRLYFRRRGADAFNLHAVAIDGQHWMSNLALRGYLRINESARQRYATAKRAAIESGATDLIAYSRAKADVIADLLAEAMANRTT